MQLINSQYRIVKILEEDKYGSRLLVKDIYKNDFIKKMRIIENTPATSDFIEYMKVNFFDYINIIHPGITKFYYFNRVRVIDTKPVLSNSFYYVYEDFDGVNIFDYIKEKSTEELLDIFVQILSAVKYLHLRGFVLCSINPKSIFIVFREGKPHVKINSFPYTIYTDKSIIINKNNSNYKAPEAIQTGEYSISSDIYLIGMLMYQLFFDETIKKHVYKQKNSNLDSKNLSEELFEIIEKCTAHLSTERYASIDEIIKDINRVFEKSYSIIDKKYIETLPRYSTKLVARETLLKRLMKNITGYFYKNSPRRLCVIKGSSGTGKDALINLFLTRLNFEGEYPAYAILKKELIEDYSGIKEVIKNVLKYADKDLIDKYINPLCEIIPELAERAKSDEMMLKEDDGPYKLTYRLGNFILETSLKWPFVIIIKNYDFMDEKSKGIINYILSSQDKNKVFLITSFESNISDESIGKIFKLKANSPVIDIVELFNYNIYETAEAIRILLGMGEAPIDFAAEVFKETEGNPYAVYETIYEAFQEKQIYVNDNGQWVLDKIDFSKIKVPLNINEAFLNKINKLEPKVRNVLDIVSIFDNAMPVDILSEVSDINANNLSSILESLVNINVLTRRMDDWGIIYDFSLTALKKFVYENIDDNKLCEFHNKASLVLEKKYTGQNGRNKNELILQMSKCGRVNDAVKYLMAASEDMFRRNRIDQAIQFLDQAYNLKEMKNHCTKSIEINLRLGDLYYKVGKYNESLKHYKISERNALEYNNKELTIDTYIKMIYVYYRLNDVKKCLKYSRLAKKVIKEVGNKEKIMDLLLSLTDLLIYRRKIGSFIKILETILKDVNKDNKLYYGRILSVYGRVLLKKGRYEDAMAALMESIETLDKLEGDYRIDEGLVAALNSIGIIYSDSQSNLEKAEEYFKKALIISKEINNTFFIMLSYNNLAETYRRKDCFNDSFVYYNKALDLAKTYPDIYIKSILYVNCALISLEVEKYDEYINYMEKGKEIIFNNKDSGDAINHYYINKAIFLYLLGDYNGSIRNVEKSIELSKTWGIEIDPNIALIELLCHVQLKDNIHFKELEKFCLSMYENKSYKISRLACNKIAEVYINLGDYDKAKKLLEMSKEYKEFKDTPLLDIIYKYLLAMTRKEGKKLELLLELTKEIDNIENIEVKWKIYKEIGLEFVKKGDLSVGLENLLTSFNYLRVLIDKVPKEYKIQFLKSHNRITVKEEILKLVSIITNKKPLKSDSVPLNEDATNIEREINRYFEYKRFKDIINKYGKEKYLLIDGVSKNIDKEKLFEFLLGFYNAINSFGNKVEENLSIISKLLADFTKAKHTFLAIRNENNDIKMVYSDIKKQNLDFYKYTTEMVRQTGKSIIISDVFDYKKKDGELLIPGDLSAIFCIPIIPPYTPKEVEKERRKIGETNNIVGYLYLDTDSIINNFTEEVGDLFKTISKIIYILIDNYNQNMINAIDKLTNLYTRKYFENALLNEISKSSSKGVKFSIIMSDIDRFKVVNDRYGHSAGDVTLANISKIIKDNIRNTDICARYGGEEFVILLPGTDSQGAFQLAEKIRKKIESARLNINHSVTISMGIATYPTHSTWMKDLIDRSDRALYHSKETGRNTTTIYDKNLEKTTKKIDKLAGIVSGNMSEDMKSVENILEILELQRSKDSCLENKVFTFLGKCIFLSNAQKGCIFIIKDGKPVKQIARKSISKPVMEKIYYNEQLLEKCIKNKSGEYLIDWSGSVSIDTVTGMPDWQSVMVIPITNDNEVDAVLYLTVSLKNKEFDANIYNYIDTLCKIIAPAFRENKSYDGR